MLHMHMQYSTYVCHLLCVSQIQYLYYTYVRMYYMYISTYLRTVCTYVGMYLLCVCMYVYIPLLCIQCLPEIFSGMLNMYIVVHACVHHHNIHTYIRTMYQKLLAASVLGTSMICAKHRFLTIYECMDVFSYVVK